MHLNIFLKKVKINLFGALFTFFLFSVSCVCHSQTSNYSYPLINNFSSQPFLNNPAYFFNSNTSCSANFHSLRGAFSDVNSSFLSVVKNIDEQKRAVGAIFNYERTSDVLTRARFYLVYQEHIQLTNKTWLSGGIQAGLINFNEPSIGFSSGGSDWSEDLALGVNIRSEKYSLGLTISQITSPTLQPIIFEFELPRQYGAFVNYDLTVNSFLIYTPEIRTIISPNNNKYYFSNNFDFFKVAGINTTVLHTDGFSFMGYYKNRDLTTKVDYQFFISYYKPNRMNALKSDADQVEMGVNFYLN